MSKSTKDMENLKRALHGIKESCASTDLPELTSPLISRLSDPPTYIVQMLLCGVAAFKSSREDKASWAVELEFQDVQFKVRDWKRSTWSICSYVDNPQSRNAAEALRRKLVSAGSLMDQILRPELQKLVDNGQFSIKNSFQSVRRPYEYFRDVLSTELHRLSEFRSKPIAATQSPELEESVGCESAANSGITIEIDTAFTNYLNEHIRLEGVVSHNASAMTASFFSYTELLFDVLFALDKNRDMKYLEFRKMGWAERFKKVLPVATEPSLCSIYEQLLDIKRTTRDVLLHGFGGQSALLVKLKPVGLIPVSYDVLEGSILFSFWHPIEEPYARIILENCQAFDEWVLQNDRTWYAYTYAESAFEIPFDSKQVNRINGWMLSRQDFLKALEEESDILDYILDQY